MSDTSTTTTAPPAGATTTAPEANTPAPAQQNNTQDNGGTTVYLTQEQFDRALGERVGRAKAQFEREHADALKNAKTEGGTEVTTKFLTKLVDSSARSLARDMGFHDPNDALAAIDRDKLPIKDDEADEDTIKKALEELVKAKPYLVKNDDGKPAPKTPPGKPKLPNGNPDPAAKANDGKMSAAEALRTLRAQSKH